MVGRLLGPTWPLGEVQVLPVTGREDRAVSGLWRAGRSGRGNSEVEKMIQSRFYNVHGVRWEARFFRKGETFPGSDAESPRQGVWMKPVNSGWESRLFVAESWKYVDMEPDVRYLPHPRVVVLRRH